MLGTLKALFVLGCGIGAFNLRNCLNDFFLTVATSSSLMEVAMVAADSVHVKIIVQEIGKSRNRKSRSGQNRMDVCLQSNSGTK